MLQTVTTDFDTALAKALSFLSKSERFEAEVRLRLKDCAPELVDLVVEHLKKRGILNDSRAAGTYRDSHSGRRSVGGLRLEADLRRRGATKEVVDQVRSSYDEKAAALDALAGKFRSSEPNIAKAFRFLVGRGFDFEVSRQVVDEYFESDVITE